MIFVKNPAQNLVIKSNFVMVYLISASGFGAWSTRFGPEYFGILLGFVGLAGLLLSNSLVKMFADVKISIYFGVLAILLAISFRIVWNSDEMVLWQAIMAICILYFINVISWVSLSNVNRGIASIFIVNVCVLSFVNIYEFAVAPGTFSTAPGRSAGFWLNPNLSAEAILLSWVMVKAAAADKRKHRLLKNISIDIIAAIGLFTTASRSGIIIFAVMYILYCVIELISNADMMREVVLKLLAIPVLISVFYALNVGSLQDSSFFRFQSLLTGDFSDESTTVRAAQLSVHWDKFLANPLTGSGAFQSIDVTQGLGPHNSYVGIAADFGVVGLIFYIIPMIIALRCIKIERPLDFISKMAFGIFIWLFLSSLFSHNIPYSVSGWVAVSTILGLAHQRAFGQLNVAQGRGST